jgi:hypothetical protein
LEVHFRNEKVIALMIRGPKGDFEDDVELRHVGIGCESLACEGSDFAIVPV